MRRRFLLSVMASDLAALALGLMLGSLTVFDRILPWQARLPPDATIWPLVGFLAFGTFIGSYLSLRMWIQGVPRPSYGRAIAIVGFSVAFTAVGLVLSRGYWSRPFLASTTLFWLAGTIAHRAVRRRRPWRESMILITSEKGLVDEIRDAPHADVIDVFDPSGEPPGTDLHVSASLVIDLRPVMSDRMAQFVSSWNLAGYPVRALSNVYEEHTGRLPMVHLAEGWELSAPVSRNEYAGFKRAVDVTLVVLTSPLWLLLAGVIAVAVRLDSGSPIIYRQERAGLRGEPFTLYKFRTMVHDAEVDGPRFASLDDARLTRVGRWLRRFRLDEVPQLWNVVKGDLSLVGPRPERTVFTHQFERSIPFYAYRHLIRPGVTGWAQVNYGYADDEADTIDKLTYDLFYVKHMSPWLDLQIIGQSLWTVVSGFGAQ